MMMTDQHFDFIALDDNLDAEVATIMIRTTIMILMIWFWRSWIWWLLGRGRDNNDFDDHDCDDDHLDGEVARLLWTSSASVIFPTFVQRDDDHGDDDDGDDFVWSSKSVRGLLKKKKEWSPFLWDRHDNNYFNDNNNITDIDNNNINVNNNDHRLRSEDRWRVKADMLLFPIVQWDFRIIHLKVWIS